MKVTRWKRVLSMFIVVLLCVSMLPMPAAFASDVDETEPAPTSTIETTTNDSDPNTDATSSPTGGEDVSPTDEGATAATEADKVGETTPAAKEDPTEGADEKESPTLSLRSTALRSALPIVGDLLPISATSAEVTRKDLINAFGDSDAAAALSRYGIAPEGETTVTTVATSGSYSVSTGYYTIYKRGLIGSSWTSSKDVTIRLYYTATFSVSGCDDGVIYLDGTSVTGSQNLYTDEEYTVTAEDVEGYTYAITGAEDGVAFTPTANVAIEAVYSADSYAMIALSYNDGGTATVESNGAAVTGTIPAGDSFTVSATPDSLYEVESIVATKDGEEVEPNDDGEYGPVADGEAYAITVTFAPASVESDWQTEVAVGGTLNQSAIATLFGSNTGTSIYYGISTVDDPDDITSLSGWNASNTYAVSAGRYIIYRTTTTTGNILNPTPVWTSGIAHYLTVRTYRDVTFAVVGNDDGAIYLDGESVTGSQRLYTDTEYTVTAEPIDDYFYEITGAEDGVPFTPDADTPATITVTYTKDVYATVTLSVGDGGTATVESNGVTVEDRIDAGNSFTVSSTPDSLYEVESIVVTKDGEEVAPNADGEYGPVADGEAYAITVTFAPASVESDYQTEVAVGGTLNRSALANLFDENTVSTVYYGISTADDPDTITSFSPLNYTGTYAVSAGRYIVYRTTTTTGGILNPTPVWTSGIAHYLTVRTYRNATFEVVGNDDGVIYLDGESVTGSQRLYTDTEYTVTAEEIEYYIYEITGAEDGVAFTPADDSSETIAISVVYTRNRFATVTLSVGEGGTATVESNGSPVASRVEEDDTFTVIAEADADNGYYVDPIVVMKDGEEVAPNDDGSYGPVVHGEEYTITVTFTKAELTLADGEVNIIDIQNGNIEALESAIIANAALTPDTLTASDITVEYLAGTVLGYEDYQRLNYTPNLLTLLTHHSFGTQTRGGELAEGNIETVRVTYTIGDLNLTLRATAEVTVADLRIPVEIETTSITITYGDDLKAAVMEAISIVGEDGNAVTYTADDITLDPDELNVQLLRYQDVTVTYGGDDTYKSGSATISVYVRQAASSIDVKSESITYGETPAMEIITTPESLDYIRVLAGIDGEATGFISIDIPESTKERMRIEVAGYTLIDIYEVLQNSIGDGVTLSGLKDIIDTIRSTIDAAMDNPVAAAAISATGFDVETLQSVLDFIAELPTVDVNAKIALGTPPKNAGVYLVGAFSADLNYRLSADIGYLTILPKTSTDDETVELRFTTEIADSNNLIPYEEAQSFVFGGEMYVNDELLETTHVRTLYVGTTFGGNISVESEEPPREPGIYTETVYVLGGNYYADPISRVYTVGRIPLTLLVDDQTVTYDGQRHSLTAYAEDGTDLQNLVAYLYTSDSYRSYVAPSAAGTYSVTAYYTGSTTHQAATAEGTLTILSAEATITATCADAVVYGALTDEDQSAAELGYTVTGVIGNDTLGIITPYIVKGESYPHVGTYKVDIDLAQANANYDITIEPASFAITPRAVVLTVDSTTKTYGDDDPAFTYSVSNLAYNDSINATLTRVTGDDVGEYTINADVEENPDYTVTVRTGVLTIYPRPVIVTVESLSKTYGDADPAFTYTLTDADGNPLDAEEVGLVITREAGNDVGTYAISAAIGNTNYVLNSDASVYGDFTIEPRPVVVTVTPITKTYGDDDPAFTYTLTDADGNPIDVDVLGFSIEREEGNDVGTYAITVSITNNNYIIDETSDFGSFTIEKKAATITATCADAVVYGALTDEDQSAAELGYTVTGVIGNDTLGIITPYIVENESFPHVGEYTVDIDLAQANANYDITIVPASFAITPRAVVLTVDSTTMTYGDDDPTFTYSVSNLAYNDSIDATLTRVTGDDVGEYTINADVEENPDYTVTVRTGVLTIYPRPVIVTVDSLSKTYGDDDPDFVYTVTDTNGNPLTAEAVGLVITRAEGSDVGTYATSASITNGNYALSDASVYGDFTIYPRPVIVTIDAGSKTYGDDDPAFTYTLTDADGNPLTAEEVGLVITRAEGSDVGTYAISAAIGNTNYILNSDASVYGNFTILPKAATITATCADAVVYGALTDEDQSAAELGYTVTGVIGNDTLGIITPYIVKGESYPHVGTYKVDIDLAQANANYDITIETASFAITPRAVVLTVSSTMKTYGDDDPAFTYSVSNLAYNDALNATLSREEGNDIGEYTINADVEENPDYTVTVRTGVLTIYPCQVIVKVKSLSKVYGDPDPAYQYTLTDPSGKPLSAETVGFVITRAEGEDVGTYAISVAIGNTNYVLNEDASVIGTLTITQRQVIVKVKSISKTYGDADPDFIYTITDEHGNPLTADAVGLRIKRAPGNDVGVYPITVKVTNPNYVLDSEKSAIGTLTIHPRQVIVKVKPLAKTYGDADPDFIYTITDLNGNPLTAEAVGFRIKRAPGENVGVYPITAKVTNPNYVLDSEKSAIGNLTIFQRQVIVKIDSMKKTYGNPDPAYRYTVTDAKGTPLSAREIGLVIWREAGENVGRYTIFAAVTNPNYILDGRATVFGTLTIESKPVIVNVKSVSKVYGDRDPRFEYIVSDTMGHPISAKEVGLAITRAKGEDVGKYPIFVSVTNPNYVLNERRSDVGVFEIVPKPVVVTVASVTKTYGDRDPALTVTVTDRHGEPINPDRIGLWIKRAPGEDVGVYPISAKIRNKNYILDRASDCGTLTIVPAQATITATCADTVVYGALTDEDQSAAELGYTVTGVLGDDTLGAITPYIVESDTYPHVGTYTVDIDFVQANANYDVTIVPASFEITPRAVVLTVDSTMKTYGDDDPAFTYSASNLAFSGSIDATLTREEGEDVGEYTICAAVEENPDYTVTVTDGVLTISPRQVIVTVDSVAKTQGDDDPAFTYTLTDMDGNPLTADTVGLEITRETGEDVGEYPITGTITNGNFARSEQSTDGILTIVAAPVDDETTPTPASGEKSTEITEQKTEDANVNAPKTGVAQDAFILLFELILLLTAVAVYRRYRKAHQGKHVR